MSQTADKYNFRIQWLPFLLRTNMPWEGRQKAPNTKDNPRVGARLKAAGERSGVDFTGKCDVYPNTILAHALLNMAKEEGKVDQDKLGILLIKAYFTDGHDVASVDNLVKWGGEAGLDESKVRSHLEDKETRREEILEEVRKYTGISGVPFFFINGKRAFSGAQGSDAFIKQFSIAAAAIDS